MTRAELDRHFLTYYPALVRFAKQRLKNEQCEDTVHAVYCQVVMAESYRPIDRSKKAAWRWLQCRVALQIKGQRREWRRKFNQGDGDGREEEQDGELER